VKTFYYTNPTKDRHKARELQLRIEKELAGIVELDNPFYNRAGTPTKEIAQLDKGVKAEISAGEIIYNDLKKIRDSEGVLAWVTGTTSWGSISETFYSSYVLGKPTYIIFDPHTRNNINNPEHPWPKGNSTKVFGSVEAFVEFAKARLR